MGTSGSRTAVNDDMGATSQVSGIASAGTIAVILLFLTGPIQYLPSAVLGAVIVYAAAKLIDAGQWRDLARSSRVELVIAAVTVACVVMVGVLQAIIVAVVLSVADIIRRAARPADAVLGWSPEDDRYVDVVDHPDAGVTPGVVVYRIQDRLFFANAHFFKRRLWAAVDGAPKPVHHVVLDASFISDIDASAEVALREVLDGLHERNIELHVARATVELRDRLTAVDLDDAIGTDHFHGTVTAAVDACRGDTASPPRSEPVAPPVRETGRIQPGVPWRCRPHPSWMRHCGERPLKTGDRGEGGPMVRSGQRTGDRSLMSFGPPAWLSGYRRPWLTRDAVAGLTLWALVVPEAMAYASIAGVPAQFGLYAVPLAVLAYAWLGTSTRLFVGPSSTICALTATVVAPLAAAGGDQYVLLTAVLSLLVGVTFIALGLLRMGFLSRLFAEPVLDGFIVGLGLYIAVGQLPKLVGLEKPEGNTVQQVGGLLREVGSWNLTSILLGAGALAALFLLHRVAPKVPAALVVVVVSILLVPTLSLEDRGVSVVGEIPAGFVFVPWDGLTLDHVIALVPGALTVVIVGFAESLAVVKAYAAKDGTTVDANRELLAYGAASIGSGVLQGFPPAGSLSKSAAAETSGAKSPLSFVTTAALVVLTILFLTGVFATLPEPVLGAIVIHAVAGMIQPRSIWRLRQIRVPDFWLALSAFLGVVLIDVTAGIVIGLVLSLVLLLQRLGQPHVARLGQHPERGFVDLAAYPDAVPVPGTLVARVDGPLVFANVDPVLEELRRGIRETSPRPDLLVLDFEATYEIDVTAATALARLLQDLKASGVEVRFAAVHAPVREYAGRLSLDPLAGLDDPYPSVADALADRARP